MRLSKGPASTAPAMKVTPTAITHLMMRSRNSSMCSRRVISSKTSGSLGSGSLGSREATRAGTLGLRGTCTLSGSGCSSGVLWLDAITEPAVPAGSLTGSYGRNHNAVAGAVTPAHRICQPPAHRLNPCQSSETHGIQTGSGDDEKSQLRGETTVLQTKMR